MEIKSIDILFNGESFKYVDDPEENRKRLFEAKRIIQERIRQAGWIEYTLVRSVFGLGATLSDVPWYLSNEDDIIIDQNVVTELFHIKLNLKRA